MGATRRALAAATPKTVIHEARIISHQPGLYHGWSTITRRKNGELLLVYSGGREAHVCPFGRVEMMRSHNEGKTWGWPRVLLDTEIDDRDAGIMETAKGNAAGHYVHVAGLRSADQNQYRRPAKTVSGCIGGHGSLAVGA